MGAWARYGGAAGRTAAVLALLFGLAGCEKHKSVVFIVDTSGSMKRESLLDEVKASIKKLLLEYGEGDQVYLLAFDGEARVIIDRVIQDPAKDRGALFDAVDSLKPEGRWTDLVNALDVSLQHVTRLREEKSIEGAKIVLYTDGRHDPPPERRTLTGSGAFTQLIAKYYSQYKAGESWFIFYVELDVPEPVLKDFLDRTDSGVVVGREALRKAEDFTEIPMSLKVPIALGLLALAFAAFWIFFVAPRLRGVAFVPTSSVSDPSRTPNRIRLESFTRGSLKRMLGMGTASDIEITVGLSRVDVSVDEKGHYYLDVPKTAGVRLDGAPVSGKQEIRVGQKLQFGRTEYVFSRDKK